MKTIPFEVKSAQTKNQHSIDAFILKYGKDASDAYVISMADAKREGRLKFLPVSCLPLLLEQR